MKAIPLSTGRCVALVPMANGATSAEIIQEGRGKEMTHAEWDEFCGRETRRVKSPRVALKAGIIYSGDNGQLICVCCAGMSAKYSGRDLSGHKVEAMPAEPAMLRAWKAEFGTDFACECGRTKYPTAGMEVAL